MFLTRFRINTGRPGARRLLASPQAMHAAVMSSFPALLPTDAPPGPQDPRVLWRLDLTTRAEVHLYVVSPARPDLTHLVEQAGWPAAAAADPTTPGWQTKDYDPLLARLSTGDRWAFRLTANPIHYIRRKDGEPTKRTAHLTPHHQMGWLLDRQDRCGFRILQKPADRRLLPEGTTHRGHPHHGDRYELTVTDKQNLSFTKAPTDGGTATPSNPPNPRQGRTPRPVTLVTATFDGRLEITDPEALRRTLTQGLGRARAYGCGLLTLAPLPHPAPAPPALTRPL
ncbi:type I-E CRISPR-associated protein Cas6/Cse3/CasE [Streptomyces lichenis]|uniref:Type I-E CRISPR-associated protein Cas6/Cse3/CasE n=1 Tax=Streptomyces lichenis TaxID=2306967 RepID=A0ABT0IDI8_9ACTN|nr:type I-E CRISPR-associated protein Cas6/Cse3/CasE [Streptomyces lichenis]MCK8679404.1 type I-E CRISPR-associated protein Cas6/Cse3/CasE [Streptomyces lichenis]